jgi:HlyD family secretion protein
MKKFFRIALFVVIGLIFLGTFYFLYSKSKPKEIVYQLNKVEVTDIEKSTVATGTIVPRDEILIKPQISGIISDVYKRAGDKVTKGEIIAKVRVIPDLGSLNAAENRVRLAEINQKQYQKDFDRNKELFDSKLISREDYEKTELTLKTSKEETATAKDALQIVREGITKSSASFSSTLIRSTIDGLILDIPIKKGNSVIMSNSFNDGTTIATVANMNDLIFDGNIDETEVGLLREGMPLTLTIGALQNLTFDASLEYISPKATKNNGANQFEIKAAVKATNTQIRSGYSANAKIILGRVTKVLAIPEGSIEFNGKNAYVYVLTSPKDAKHQTFRKQLITTGMSNGMNIEVKSGLKAGEQIRGDVVNNDDKNQENK